MEYPLQAYLGDQNPRDILEKRELKNRFPKLKPVGGLWTSSFREDLLSEWIRWRLANEYYKPAEETVVWELRPSEDANLYRIQSQADLESIASDTAYPGEEWVIDFEGLAEEYDGIWLAPQALPTAIEFPEPALTGWDIECTLWFRDVFDSVEPRYQLKWPEKGGDSDWSSLPSIE